MANKKIVGYTCLALAACLWGAMYVVGKFVMDYLPPFFVLWLRYFIAFWILFIISYFFKKERIKKTDLPFMAWIGFIGYFVSNGGAFLGTHLSSAQLGALIAATPPIFTVFLATWILKEKLTFKKAASILLATIGILLVVGIRFEEQQGSYLLGSFILALGSLAWALYTIFVKGIQCSAVFVSTYATGFGLLFITPVMLLQLEEKDFPHLFNLHVVFSILYLGVFATALAFFLWNKGMQYVDAGVGSIFTFFNVIAGGILGWLILGETLTWNFFAGGILVLAATIMMLMNNRLHNVDEEKIRESRLDENS